MCDFFLFVGLKFCASTNAQTSLSFVLDVCSIERWNEWESRTLLLSFDVLPFLFEKYIRAPLLCHALHSSEKNEERDEKETDDGSKERMTFPFLRHHHRRRLCSTIRSTDNGRDEFSTDERRIFFLFSRYLSTSIMRARERERETVDYSGHIHTYSHWSHTFSHSPPFLILFIFFSTLLD